MALIMHYGNDYGECNEWCEDTSKTSVNKGGAVILDSVKCAVQKCWAAVYNISTGIWLRRENEQHTRKTATSATAMPFYLSPNPKSLTRHIYHKSNY